MSLTPESASAVTHCAGGAWPTGTTVGIQTCTGTAEQLWTYLAQGAPGAPDEVTINGLCLSLAAGGPVLATCNRGDATQSWRLGYGAILANIGSRTCLETAAGFQNPLTMRPCNSAVGYQQWHLIGATLQSGAPGMCLAVNDDGFHSSPYMIEPCGHGYLQSFAFNAGDSVESSLDRCMLPGPGGVASGSCSGGPAGYWLPGPGGELINDSAGLCLDDPGGSQVAGTQLVLPDCYGTIGEIWAIA